MIKLFGQVVLGSKINVAITQEGPGTVYLRWKSLLGQGIFIQCVTPVEPFLQRVIHIYFTMPSVPVSLNPMSMNTLCKERRGGRQDLLSLGKIFFLSI